MPKPRHNDRRCVATGEMLPPGALAIRFGRAPDGTLVPDVSEKLPGRGAWLIASPTALQRALKKGAFAKSFRAATSLPQEMDEAAFIASLSDQLEGRALNALGLARRAGQLTMGFEKVKEKGGTLLAYITPSDAAPDGVRKVLSKLEPKGEPSHIQISVESEALSRALGEVGVVHIGLLPGKASSAALYEIKRWCSFLEKSPENENET
ncbi:MAG: DUF448 domain-containing protein [Pseudomonadota bacterium]